MTRHKPNKSADKSSGLQHYKTLRIDEAREPDEDEDEEDETFLGRNYYKKEKTPKNLDSHLEADDDNMIHFTALLKYYGVNSDLVSLPESVLSDRVKSNQKFKIDTPDAK